MPLEEPDLKYLWDMLASARDAVTFVAGVSHESYLTDKMRQAAVERTIEIIGEAARRVSEPARRQLSAVEWGAIVATRHILAHEYGDIDQDQIWRIATTHVPKLIKLLTPVLDANPPGPESRKDPGEP